MLALSILPSLAPQHWEGLMFPHRAGDEVELRWSLELLWVILLEDADRPSHKNKWGLVQHLVGKL